MIIFNYKFEFIIQPLMQLLIYNIILKQKLVILIYFSILFFCMKIKIDIDKKENYNYNNKRIKLGINTIGIKGGGRARITAIFVLFT